MDGGAGSQPKLILVRERRDLCVDTKTSAEDSSLAASARTGKGRLIDNVCFIYGNHLLKRLRVDGHCADFGTPLTNVTG